MQNECLQGTEVNELTLDLAVKTGDPYQYYDFLRTNRPIHWDAHLGGWFCTRYSDVIACLRDKRLSAKRAIPCRAGLAESSKKALDILDSTLRLWMVFKEPPEHSKVRNVCNKGFTQTVVDGLRPQIEKVINDLLDQLPTNGTLDFIGAFAYLMPTRVISPLFGISPVDVPALERWSDEVVEAFGTGNLTLKAAKSYNAMIEYLGDVLKDGHCVPDQILMRIMLEAQQTAVLNTEELLANCVFLFLAGRDTTTNLIGNGIFTLLTHPDQFELLRSDRSLIPSAVEEILRVESPVQYVSRTASEEFELGGYKIKKQQGVFLSVGAANRDPTQFSEPDRVDIQRQNNHHLAFIAGVHYCLGTHLARLEGQLVLNALLDRFSRIELIGEPVQWKPNPVIRSLKRLDVRVWA